MRFAGVDIASETHVVAVVGDNVEITVKPTSFAEDAAGYRKLFDLLGAPGDLLVAMEATGHYWKNLFAALATAGFAVARCRLADRLRRMQPLPDAERTSAFDPLQLVDVCKSSHSILGFSRAAQRCANGMPGTIPNVLLLDHLVRAQQQ